MTFYNSNPLKLINSVSEVHCPEASSSLNIKSVLGRYFNLGLVPRFYVNLNSKMYKDSEEMYKNREKEMNRNYNEVEFEKNVKGVDLKVKVKIRVIENIRRDCSLEWLEKFECLSDANGWNDMQMGIICFSLIEDECKNEFNEESYVSLRQSIIKILYPVTDRRWFNAKAKTIRQENYVYIKDYYDECLKYVKEYAILNNASKRVSEKKFEEIFFDNLEGTTILELKKKDMFTAKLKDIMIYLEGLEKEILIQAELQENEFSEEMNEEEENEWYDENVENDKNYFNEESIDYETESLMQDKLNEEKNEVQKCLVMLNYKNMDKNKGFEEINGFKNNDLKEIKVNQNGQKVKEYVKDEMKNKVKGYFKVCDLNRLKGFRRLCERKVGYIMSTTNILRSFVRFKCKGYVKKLESFKRYKDCLGEHRVFYKVKRFYLDRRKKNSKLMFKKAKGKERPKEMFESEIKGFKLKFKGVNEKVLKVSEGE